MYFSRLLNLVEPHEIITAFGKKQNKIAMFDLNVTVPYRTVPKKKKK